MFASRQHIRRFTITLFMVSTALSFQILVFAPAQAPAFEVLAAAEPPPADGEGGQPRRQRLDPEEQLRRISPEGTTGIPKPTVVLEPGQVPQIDFETPALNFGRVMASQMVRHDFWFKNVGTGPLEVLRVKPSCNCTHAGEYDRIVQPGQRGKISIQVDTTRLGGDVTKSVIVNTNTPSDSRVILSIRGQVWRPMEATPKKASFGRVRRDLLESQPPAVTLTLVNNLKTPARLAHLRSGNPAFSGAIKVLEPGKKFELVVSAHAPMETGLNHTLIDIDTGLREMPVLRIPASIYVTAAVDVAPAKLSLLQSRPRDVRRSFFITNHTTIPFTVSDPQVSNPMLKATITATRPGSAYRLLLKIPAAYKVPSGGDTITLKTTHPNAPTLTIPIVVRTAPSR